MTDDASQYPSSRRASFQLKELKDAEAEYRMHR
jgi:hypothetical protein